MRKTTLLLLALVLAPSAQAIAGEPDKVLFVGNSFTYYNNGLHKHYEAIVESANGLLHSRIMTISSVPPGTRSRNFPRATRCKLAKTN